MWLSTDPLQEKYPNISTYAYTFLNPVKYIDPTGMEGEPGDGNGDRYARVIPRTDRKEYGDSSVGNVGKFLYNSLASFTNLPYDVADQLIQESKYIYYEGVGSYLGQAATGIGNSVSNTWNYHTGTPLSTQADHALQDLQNPIGWENAIGTTAWMFTPVKGSGAGSKSMTPTISNPALNSTTKILSPNVEKVVNSLKELKSSGGTIKNNPLSPTQELNMTIQKGAQKLDLRIETHTVPSKYGGNGATPQKHMNVDLTPGKKTLPYNGHKMLE